MKRVQIDKFSNQHPEQLLLHLPISPLLKKKTKIDCIDSQDIDIVKQLQGIGLQTVIAQENTSEEQLTSHNHNFITSTNSQMDAFKATTEFDHDHILDYSNLNNKFEKSNRINHLGQTKKAYSALQLLKKQLEAPKYIIAKIREGLRNMAEQTQRQVKKMKEQFQKKIQAVLFTLQSQLNFTKMKNYEYQEDIKNLGKKLQEKQSYIAILQIERESNIKKSVQTEKYKNLSQLTQITQSKSQIFQLRNRITSLEKEKAELKEEIRKKQDKNILYGKNMLVNSITSQELDLKHKYIMMLQKFSNQFERVSEEVEERKMREIQNNNNLYQWEAQLIHQQQEINEIIGNLQEREQSIQRKQSFLLEKQTELSLREKQLFRTFHQEKSHPHLFQPNQRNLRAPQNSQTGNRSPDNGDSSSRQKNRNFLKAFNQKVPTQTKSSACLLKTYSKGPSRHRYTQYGNKDSYGKRNMGKNSQLFENKRNYPKRQMKNLTGRIDQLQLSLQQELVALERRY